MFIASGSKCGWHLFKLHLIYEQVNSNFISLYSQWPDRISNRCNFWKMVWILSGFFSRTFLLRETCIILTEHFFWKVGIWTEKLSILSSLFRIFPKHFLNSGKSKTYTKSLTLAPEPLSICNLQFLFQEIRTSASSLKIIRSLVRSCNTSTRWYRGKTLKSWDEGHEFKPSPFQLFYCQTAPSSLFPIQ